MTFTSRKRQDCNTATSGAASAVSGCTNFHVDRISSSRRRKHHLQHPAIGGVGTSQKAIEMIDYPREQWCAIDKSDFHFV
jgi:hypothetical protein